MYIWLKRAPELGQFSRACHHYHARIPGNVDIDSGLDLISHPEQASLDRVLLLSDVAYYYQKISQ